MHDLRHNELLAAFRQGMRITAMIPTNRYLPAVQFEVLEVDEAKVVLRSAWGGKVQVKPDSPGMRYWAARMQSEPMPNCRTKNWVYRPMSIHTVAVLIGNSDDKLSQVEWARFVRSVLDTVCGSADKVHFEGHTPQASSRQSVAIVFEINTVKRQELQGNLKKIKQEFRQDSIAWVEGTTLFL